MITNARTGRPLTRVGILAASAVAVLLSAPCTARTGDEPEKREKSPEKFTEVTREDLATRVPNFFCFNYAFGDQPGKRLWLRLDDKHWVERYPDGKQTRFKVLGRAEVLGNSGTVAVKIAGAPGAEGPEKEDTLRVFIPDKGKEEMLIMYKYVKEEETGWVCLGIMEKIE